jgi:hypothetical protein
MLTQAVTNEPAIIRLMLFMVVQIKITFILIAVCFVQRNTAELHFTVDCNKTLRFGILNTMSVQIKSERSDDIPLIIYWVSQMKIKEWVDEVLPAEHGNRQGLSYGQLTVLTVGSLIFSPICKGISSVLI